MSPAFHVFWTPSYFVGTAPDSTLTSQHVEAIDRVQFSYVTVCTAARLFTVDLLTVHYRQSMYILYHLYATITQATCYVSE